MSIVSSKIEVEIRGKSYTFDRVAWTGGSGPTKEAKTTAAFKALRRFYFRELLGICGRLDLWACAGTGGVERAGIFWNQATLDAHATLRDHNRRN